MPNNKMFNALVTFERTEADNEILPPEAQGAVGYMAISAIDEDDLSEALVADLKHVGLRLLEIDEIREIDPENLPAGIDEHLAKNIQDWIPGARTTWGMLHVYLADGEA